MRSWISPLQWTSLTCVHGLASYIVSHAFWMTKWMEPFWEFLKSGTSSAWCTDLDNHFMESKFNIRYLKQKTLHYRFRMADIPCVKHKTTDSLSRHPTGPTYPGSRTSPMTSKILREHLACHPLTANISHSLLDWAMAVSVTPSIAQWFLHWNPCKQ